MKIGFSDFVESLQFVKNHLDMVDTDITELKIGHRFAGSGYVEIHINKPLDPAMIKIMQQNQYEYHFYPSANYIQISGETFNHEKELNIDSS